MRSIYHETLRYLLEQRSTLALVDVREHGEYNLAHIPGSSSLPRRLLEGGLERLVPCKSVQLVLCDDDGQRARLAARTAERMGYTNVAVLQGGVNRWATAGLPTEWGMNVPSKDFGERVEVEHHVPTIEADDLHRRLRRGDRVVILDTRTPEEYGRWCIPGGRSMPGGELAYRAGEIVRQQPDATLVINCAGRTRSIIGTRILQRMGLKNVVSLKNGTSGWMLAGYELEQQAGRFELPEPRPETRAEVEAFAARVAAEDGVQLLSVLELRDLLERAGRACVYPVDVRTEAEYAEGHIPGFWWFPGGQCVQRSDDVVAVRNGTIVFTCDGLARAGITASWFRQLGFPHVYALDGGVAAWRVAGLPLEQGANPARVYGLAEAAVSIRGLEPARLQAAIEGGEPPVVLFVETSRAFAAGHVPGARWLSRSWLELKVQEVVPDHDRAVVASDIDGQSAPLAAATLKELGYADVSYLQGGTVAWGRAGLPLERGLSGVMAPPDDVVPAGPERTYADMVQYLTWEEKLGHKYGQ